MSYAEEIKNATFHDFPGGLVVRTPHFQWKGMQVRLLDEKRRSPMWQWDRREQRGKNKQNTMFPLFVAPFLFPTGYRTFKLAVHHVMERQGENRSRRRGQNRTVTRKSGWTLLLRRPPEHFPVLGDQDGRAQLKRTNHIENSFSNQVLKWDKSVTSDIDGDNVCTIYFFLQWRYMYLVSCTMHHANELYI